MFAKISFGEEGSATPRAAASICAPIDLGHLPACCDRATASTIDFSTRSRATGDRQCLGLRARGCNLRRARSIWDYDRAFIAPRDYGGAATRFYGRRLLRALPATTRFMSGIGIPTLCRGPRGVRPVESTSSLNFRARTIL